MMASHLAALHDGAQRDDASQAVTRLEIGCGLSIVGYKRLWRRVVYISGL